MSRIGIASLVLSAVGIIQLALSEGYKGVAYQPLPGDKQTIGFGATEGVKPVRKGGQAMRSCAYAPVRV